MAATAALAMSFTGRDERPGWDGIEAPAFSPSLDRALPDDIDTALRQTTGREYHYMETAMQSPSHRREAARFRPTPRPREQSVGRSRPRGRGRGLSPSDAC